MDTPHPEIADVEQNAAPGILIFSDHRGVPISFNPAARRLFDLTSLATWDHVIDGEDLDRFRLELQKATAAQSTVDGWYRVRRFDNAIRQFILRAEPRFDRDGQFFGHLVSGLDASGLPSATESAAECDNERKEVQELACRWHDWIVKDATVISVSVDLLLDELRPLHVSETVDSSLNRLHLAAESLRREVDLLLRESRGN